MIVLPDLVVEVIFGESAPGTVKPPGPISFTQLTGFVLSDNFTAMQVTIEIPDEQARRLGMDREGLEKLIARLLQHLPHLTFVEEIIEFLGRGPQPEEIVAFHASEKSQQRVRELLDKNHKGALTPDEEAELDAIESWNHLFALVKARAWQHLPASS